LLPLYVDVEAQVMACMLSPLNIRNHVKNDLIIRILLDDEVVEWDRSFVELKCGSSNAWTLCVVVGWVENFNTMFYFPFGIQCIQSFPSYCISYWRPHHSTLATYLMNHLHLDIQFSFILTLVGKIIPCTHCYCPLWSLLQ
jgi:hypothetical protein